MEQSLESQKPTLKIYNEKLIVAGTFLGGPLVAGYFIAHNFKAFNEPDKANRTWVYAILTTVIIFGFIFLIPESVNIPNRLIPLIYTAITFFLVQRFQEQKIKAHIDSGGVSYRPWRMICVSLIGCVITVIPILGFIMVPDMIANAAMTSKTYGNIKNEISFDKNNISETEVDRIATSFKATTYFDEVETKYVHAKKVNNSYELSLSMMEGIEKNQEAIVAYAQLRNDLQTFFPNNKIILLFVVNDLNNVVKRFE